MQIQLKHLENNLSTLEFSQSMGGIVTNATKAMKKGTDAMNAMDVQKIMKEFEKQKLVTDLKNDAVNEMLESQKGSEDADKIYKQILQENNLEVIDETKAATVPQNNVVPDNAKDKELEYMEKELEKLK
jgi:hypothetical protein